MAANLRPFTKNSYIGGPYHGNGQPGKVGTRRGTFNMEAPPKPNKTKIPPKKLG